MDAQTAIAIGVAVLCAVYLARIAYRSFTGKGGGGCGGGCHCAAEKKEVEVADKRR